MNEINPYAPPIVEEALPGPAGEGAAYKLYTPGQISLAAFLGSPVTGMYLLSVNQRRLGRARRATTTLLVGIGATLLLVVVGFVTPGSSGSFIPLAATAAVASLARTEQPLLDVHLARGGAKESGWKAAGIGLLGMLGLLAVLVGYVIVIGDP